MLEATEAARLGLHMRPACFRPDPVARSATPLGVLNAILTVSSADPTVGQLHPPPFPTSGRRFKHKQNGGGKLCSWGSTERQ